MPHIGDELNSGVKLHNGIIAGKGISGCPWNCGKIVTLSTKSAREAERKLYSTAIDVASQRQFGGLIIAFGAHRLPPVNNRGRPWWPVSPE
ncbi:MULTISPECIES: hypothetical protein [Sphingomonadaceae]|uniref:hypothetical protein n=1 Tax=Sphingomonadales TaxID=204457 RepID=UPI000F4E2673|nr:MULTISPECIES: hypothetical protein [Sphingomonadaceae]